MFRPKPTLLFIDPLLPKRRIPDPNITNNPLIHNRQNNIPIPMPQTHVEKPTHLLPPWRIKRGGFEQRAELRRRGDGGLRSGVDDGYAEVGFWGV